MLCPDKGHPMRLLAIPFPNKKSKYLANTYSLHSLHSFGPRSKRGTREEGKGQAMLHSYGFQRYASKGLRATNTP